MKANILLLIIMSSLISCCRTKSKITDTYKEKTEEKEKIKTDSSNIQNLNSLQSTSTDELVKENKNELSGEMSIKGKSDLLNPFVLYNVVGKDTVQSISITGNAEYSIHHNYTKTNLEKSEVKKEEFTNIIQEIAQNTVVKEKSREIDFTITEETRKVKINGFQAGLWIVFAIVAGILILIFFTYKYLKK